MKASTPPLFVMTHDGDGVVNPEFTLREMRGFVYENGRGVLAGSMGRCEKRRTIRAAAFPRRRSR